MIFYRFGIVTNNETKGNDAIRGWNRIESSKASRPLQYYCNKENGLADCFEEEINGFTVIHRNYYRPNPTQTPNKWKYDAAVVCGESGINGPNIEQAQGVICR